ncbi:MULTISPECIES: hypothetical protein [Halobacteriovorax]|uniref:Uncharacterized protein n=1 Tax=Halobacteriovorax vibrionivorans TaxID=2152716 RepID=A0ABY0IFQ8_9BACT|nr:MULTISPECIES: hypothetical protein [Halobacteriovorax]RZF21791.1 hypothetical protein DAY19_08870 [Halobacteriovorax vibrionivorans]TGD48374.1 hypothetical protein EP118_04425 [Halobacteriovorax sp. Y22]
MDTEFLNDVQKHQHLFKDEVLAQEVHLITCPKCNSDNIKNDRCQMCDYDLSFNPLGSPLGEKSFYTFREKYWQTLSPLEMENPQIFKGDVKFKKFLVKVRRRYNNLLDYFYSEASKSDELRPLYLQELADIVIEMMNSGVSEQEIWHPYAQRGIEEFSLYERIKAAIGESKDQSTKEQYENFFNYKMMGVFKVSYVLYGMLVAVFLISMTLALTSYFRAI